jgi:hypothetical protein
VRGRWIRSRRRRANACGARETRAAVRRRDDDDRIARREVSVPIPLTIERRSPFLNWRTSSTAFSRVARARRRCRRRRQRTAPTTLPTNDSGEPPWPIVEPATPPATAPAVAPNALRAVDRDRRTDRTVAS